MVKVIVFDLDETIGHFVQLSILDYKLRKFYNKDLSKDHFHKILDIFPEVFRPNMLNIFKYLHKMKVKYKGKIKIMIYTNNNGCRMWVNRIKSYIEKKINDKIFDRVICAWKHDGKILEKNRTGYEKKYSDLLKCGHLKKTDKILFLDDQLYEKMFHPQLTYLHLTPYHYKYDNNTIISKYINNIKLPYDKSMNLARFLNIKESTNKCNNQLKNTNFKFKSKKIERHIKTFFESFNKTRNIKEKKNNKTKKNKKVVFRI
jgi:hypothetical protein